MAISLSVYTVPGLCLYCSLACSVVDPEWFIPDPDPAMIFLSSGSNPYLEIVKIKHLKFNQKEEYPNYMTYGPTVNTVQNS